MQAPTTTVAGVPLSDQSRRRLRALAKRRDQTAAEIADAIVVARDEQATLREIATELGMSHGGVAFIEQKARKERGEDV